MVITRYALKEKLRRKDFYAVIGISVFIMVVFSTGSGTLSLDGVAITDFINLLPFLMVFVNTIGGALAIALSLSTIPNEYERKTSHLVWIRGIKQISYHGQLAFSNILSGVLAVGILYIGVGVLAVVKGELSIIPRMLLAFFILCINIIFISLFTSVVSIILPTLLAGVISVTFLSVGVLHSLIELAPNMMEGLVSRVIKLVLIFVPNLNLIQLQASNVILHKEIDVHGILGGLLAIYIVTFLLFLCRRKEA
jgi:hypothetical protein